MTKICVKYISFLAIVSMLVMGCLSTPETTKSEPSPKKREARYVRENIEWTGAKTGQDIPDWLVVADSGDAVEILNANGLDKALAGKYWIVVQKERLTNGINPTNLKLT